MTSDAPLAVVDASVAVKWFATENEDSVDSAAELLYAHAEGLIRLVGPALLSYELMNTLRRRSREVGDLVAAMEGFVDAAVLLIPPDRELTRAAARICTDHGTSAADAAYAALSLRLDCELMTADRRLARSLEGLCRVRLI